MLISQDQFRQFLIDIGFKKVEGFWEDVLFDQEMFGYTWVYFTGTPTPECNQFMLLYLATDDEIDLGDFIKQALHSRDLQVRRLPLSRCNCAFVCDTPHAKAAKKCGRREVGVGMNRKRKCRKNV